MLMPIYDHDSSGPLPEAPHDSWKAIRHKDQSTNSSECITGVRQIHHKVRKKRISRKEHISIWINYTFYPSETHQKQIYQPIIKRLLLPRI